MANIQPEISAFETAVYGEEVRGSMISLANKLNDEVTADTTNVTNYTADINTKMTTLGTELTTVQTMQNTLNTQQAQVVQLTTDAKGYKDAAATSATNASASAQTSSNEALESEGWALGTQGGLPVAQGSPYYQNNAKYYKDQAASISYQQADWNEDIASQSSYINNRPFKTIGYGLTVENNILKSNVPLATTQIAGLVCPDGDTITIGADGKIHGAGGSAENITYDNTDSGLDAENVQDAIDELATDVSTLSEEIANLEAGGSNVICQFEADYVGQNATLTIGTKTYTKVIDDNAKAEFGGVAEVGMATVSCGQASRSFNIACYSQYTLTVNAYGYQGWLDSASITTSFADLTSVLSDEKTVRQLMTKHASVDYLVEWYNNDNSIMSTFVGSTNAMKWIGLRDYACDKLMGISAWKSAMLSSDNWEYILKDKVPTMTSNSAPYGECSCGANYSGYEPYKAFDNNDSTMWIGSTGASSSAQSGYIQYKFTNPTNVKKINYVIGNHGTDGRNCTSLVLKGSNDGSTFTTLYSNTDGVKELTTDIDNDNYYLYYRLEVTESGSGSQAKPSINTLQFYGRSLNVSVPTMTSDTTPWGEVSVSSVYEDGAYGQYGWKAFAQLSGSATADMWNTKNEDTTPWIQYRFNSPVCIKKFKLKNRGDDDRQPYAKNIQLIGSNDNFTSERVVLGSYVNPNTKGGTTFFEVDNNSLFLYYKLQVNTRYDAELGIAIQQLQFYGLDYSEDTTITIYSASNDTVYYTENGSNVTVCTTDADGKGSANIDSISSNTVLYSTVAKDTTSGTSAFSKTLSDCIDNDNLMVMPNGAIYWYGYTDTDLVGSWKNASATSSATVTPSTNKYQFSQPTVSSGAFPCPAIVSTNTIQMIGKTLKGIVDNSIQNAQLVIGIKANANNFVNTSSVDSQLLQSEGNGDIGKHLYSLNISSNGYVAIVMNRNSTGTTSNLYALWYE